METIVNSFFQFFDTISIIVQYLINGIRHLFFFVTTLARGISYLVESMVFLPPFFLPIVLVVIAIMVIKFLIPGGD